MRSSGSDRLQAGSKCGEEWARFGTCCNITLLAEEANHVEELSKGAAASIFESIETMHEQTQSLLNKKVEFETQDLQSAKKSKLVQHLNDKWKRIDSVLLGLLNDKGLKPSMNKCVDKFVKVIQKSLCSICSGRSEQFFPKSLLGNKALVTQEACGYYIEDCIGN